MKSKKIDFKKNIVLATATVRENFLAELIGSVPSHLGCYLSLVLVIDYGKKPADKE